MKRLKYAILLILSIFTLLNISACHENSSKTSGALAENEVANGKKIYLEYCKHCHGVDGTLGLNGAANLKRSALLKKDVIRTIKDGRNTMQPYNKLLSTSEIEAVTDFIMKLRN